ncbi:hypothetical protein RIR_jg19243.t1 [Rhizophagus irregularis DAOM 181602=DAOM 197198]|nr:hypothetical protein RIR_jg19243.t1 [Rhizophagus irregularis DAOM 181602=DAOM 197198]
MNIYFSPYVGLFRQINHGQLFMIDEPSKVSTFDSSSQNERTLTGIFLCFDNFERTFPIIINSESKVGLHFRF